MNKDPTYKIAFIMGVASFIVPILIYKLGGFHKRRSELLERNQPIQFKDIFPKKD